MTASGQRPTIILNVRSNLITQSDRKMQIQKLARLLNDVIYNYFSDNFGQTKTIPHNDMVAKYKEYTVKELKRALQDLKHNNGELSEIRYCVTSSEIKTTIRD